MEKPKVCKRMIYLAILFKLKIEYLLFCLFHRGILSPSERSQKLILKESISVHKALKDESKNFKKDVNRVLKDFRKSPYIETRLDYYKDSFKDHNKVFEEVERILNCKKWNISKEERQSRPYRDYDIISFVIKGESYDKKTVPMLGSYR